MINNFFKVLFLTIFITLPLTQTTYAFEVKNKDINITIMHPENIINIESNYDSCISINYKNKDEITYYVSDLYDSIFQDAPTNISPESPNYQDNWISYLKKPKNGVMPMSLGTIKYKKAVYVIWRSRFDENLYICKAMYILNNKIYTVSLNTYSEVTIMANDKTIEYLTNLIENMYPC